MTQELKEAARRLAAPALAEGFSPEALHTYRDAEGNPIYWRIRAKNPATGDKWIRPMHLNGHGYRLGEPKFNGLKPLYNLDEITKAAQSAPVFIVEGEKAADALSNQGVLATTSGGSESADRTDWTPCRGRNCVIWRDHDEAGQQYAESVERTLSGVARTIEWIEVAVLELPAKGDAADWIAAHPNATAADVLALPKRARRHEAAADTPQVQPLSENRTGAILTTASIVLRATREWPEPLDDAAFQGLAGDIVREIEPHTEADPAAILVQTLVVFGSLVGRGPHIRVEGDEHHPNFNALLVGDTSKARKGTSWGRVRALYAATQGMPHVVEGLSSGEGLKYAVRDPIRRLEKDKQGFIQEVEVDSGVADKRLLVVESEFAQVLRQCARPGNTLSATIRSAWDTGTLQTLTKNDPVTATGAHISIIGHITADELRAELTVTDSANGFANRFLFMAVRRSKQLPFGGGDLAEAVRSALTSRIASAVDRARMNRDMQLSPAARDAWVEVYPTLSEGHRGLLGAVTARAEAQTLRLALVYALMDESHLIDLPHLQAALAVWERCEASARFIFGSALGDRIADEILRGLKSTGGMARTDISGLFKRNESAERIGAALELLMEWGLARSHKEPVKEAGAGRPKEIWEAV